LKRLFLHAHSIGFKAPDGSRVDVHAPLPEDLRAVLDGLD
jgi:23S rRNA-/tRNA-specific pseudouridylate synthase